MFDWIKKQIVKRWEKELKANIDGMRKMAQGYREQGGFKEIAEMIKKAGEEFSKVFPEELLKEGRELELQFADICERLADVYEKLFNIIHEILEKL